jgi:hypothetical protein
MHVVYAREATTLIGAAFEVLDAAYDEFKGFQPNHEALLYSAEEREGLCVRTVSVGRRQVFSRPLAEVLD